MAVPDTTLRNAKPENKRYRISVGGSVYLEVMTTGRKVWRMRYRRPVTKNQVILTIGDYPDISQPDARQAARDAKALLAKGIDPAEHRKQQELIRQQEAEEEAERIKRKVTNSFENVARDWHANRHKTLKKWSDKHAAKILTALNDDVFKEIGNRPIADLKAPDFLDVIQIVVDRGALETARKINQWINAICRYAAVRGLVQHNEAANIDTDELPTLARRHNPHLAPEDLREFIRDVDGGDMGEIVKIGILFTLHTLARTGEARFAKWSEFDFESRLWIIPAERMKMRRPHVVPLSEQVIALLERLRAFTGQYEYLFVTRGWNKPMSENAMLYALYRLGWKGRVTVHGLRGTGSTILNDSDSDFNADWIESALAHVDKNTIRAAYNHALYLEERRKMMQWYSDYLDGLQEKAQVIPINRKLA